MAYDSNVFRRAVAQLERDVTRHQAGLTQNRRSIYRAAPKIAAIEKEMKVLSLKLCKAPFDRRIDADALDRRMTVLRRERAEQLVNHGFDAFALDDMPLCSLCGDTGWLREGMCACLKRYCVRQQMRELTNTMALGDQSFDRFRLDVYSAAPDPTLGNSPRQNMEQVLARCKHYAARFGKEKDKNLLFTGGTGLGKTYLSACIAREVSEGGHSVVYDTAVNVVRRFEQEKFRDDDDAKDETRRYLGCDLLIIDDLGCETINAFAMSALYDLINSRLVERRATIISTNLSPAELRKRYSPQIYSRLLGEYQVQPFFGEDIRMKRMNN